MNSTPAFLGQIMSTGDTRAAFLTLFSGEVIAAAQSVLKFKDTIRWKTISGGKAFQFPFIGGASVAYHTPGTEITGNAINKQIVTVDPDDALIASVFLDRLDETLSHYDGRSQHAADLGYKIAELVDSNIMRSVLKAARASAVIAGDSYAGTSKVVANSAVNGSTLFGALLDAQVTLKGNKLVRNGEEHYAALAPLQYSLVMRAPEMANTQYRPAADSENMFYSKINGMSVIESTNTPFGETYNANSTVLKAAYNLDFSNTVAAVWTKDAACAAEAEVLSTDIIDQPHKRGTLLLAQQTVGIRPLNSGAAYEIKKA